MNNRRKLVIAIGAGALVSPLAAYAQQKGKVWRIGFLGATTAPSFAARLEALRAGLREFGYIEGKNLVIEYRWADGNYERFPDLAAELVRLKVDVIVTHGNSGIRAAKAATTTIPIVMGASGDPVTQGLVTSLARPGGNVTGVTGINPETYLKRLELLREALPRARKVAVLFNPDNPGGIKAIVQGMEGTAAALKLELQQLGVRGPGELDKAFAAMAKQRVDAVVVSDDAVLTANVKAIANLATETRLPSIGQSEFAEAGGLMAYGANRVELFRRAAYFVDKIFKGARPGDLPVEQATKFEVIVNLNTAKALGIKFPQTIVVHADRVIE